MRFLFGLFVLSFVASAQASLPVVLANDFTPGRRWIWDYFESSGAIYSTERYEVISRRGSVVVIELASDYGGGQNLKPTTRIEVDVRACLAAYANPVAKKPWQLKLFYPDHGVWTETDQSNTLAFEEKFNCNPNVYSSAGQPYLTVYDVIDGTPVFQQKLWQRVNESWFAQDGPLAAIQIHKDFVGGGSQAYQSRIRR